MGHDPIAYSMQPGAIAQYAPQHWVHLSPFFIDKYPVTNARYLACFQAGACPNECQANGECVGGWHGTYHIADPTLADYPMANATPADAEAFCAWAGRRLPTEAQWERAARGPQSFDYPWGNGRPDCSQMHCGGLAQPAQPWPYSAFYPVADGGSDVSPEGMHDAVTNVAEVVQDYLDINYYKSSPVDDPQGPGQGTDHVARGKFFWVTPDEYGVSDWPEPAWARDVYGAEGFRCARDGTTAGASKRFFAIRQRILTGAGVSP